VNTSSFAGRRALVTGANSGIGAAVAKQLADAGAEVVLIGRDRERLWAVASGLSGGQEHRVVDVDLTDDGAVAGLAEYLADEDLALHVLVHSAGMFNPKPFEAITLDDLAATWAINARAPFRLTQALLPRMVDGGAIVFVTSVSGHVGMAGQTAYGMTKSAVEGLVRALAVELAPRRIRVNAVAPGYTATPMNAGFRQVCGAVEKRAQAALAGRVAAAEEIARVIVFVASADASFVIGTSVHVDGGYPTADLQRAVSA
jgi:NAD(P)-dependent dehydrogenase (short-subunit alcohol dehydrogenase family)